MERCALVAVTGANGFVGGHIGTYLAGRGNRVAGIVRKGRSGTTPAIDYREVSEWSARDLSRVLDGAETLVHAASVVHRPGATVADHQAFNVEGTRVLLAAAEAAGVKRIVFLSTIKVHGEASFVRIDESTPVSRESPYASTKLDAENFLLEAAARGGPSVAVFRLCPVYGPGDKGNVRKVATSIARRRFAIPGDGSTRKSLVHVSIVAAAVDRAIQSSVSGVFVLADREAPSMRELADVTAAVLGRRPPPSIPVPVAIGVATAFEALARLRGREPTVSRDLLRKSMTSTVCSPAKIEETFGLSCHHDLRDGINEEVAWLRSEGLL